MRKKNVKAQVVIGLLLLGSLAACKKDGLIDVGPRDELLREVTFRIKPFETKINPLMSKHSAYGSLGMTQVSEGNVSPSENEQMLYLWTFNQQSLVPDIGIDTVGAEILALKNNGSSQVNYGDGFGFGDLPKGRAISITGLDEVRFSMPLSYTSELSTIRFDAHSSDTGPKSFSIFYSLDPTGEPILLSDTNFLFVNATFKSFDFDLGDLNISDNVVLQIIIKAKEGGDRPEGREYNPSQGTFRIDNFALTGFYSGPEIEPLNLGEGNIHYHVFNAADSVLVQTGDKLINSDHVLPELALKLADGEYFISFAANFSEEPLLYPTSINHAKDLFLYQKLSDNAAVYGTLLSGLEISADLTMDLEMERYFSEVNFEFTDDKDLSNVQKIEIESLSKPFFSPYNIGFDPVNELIQLEDKIIFYPEFDDSNNIRFYQFLGKTTLPKSVSYKLTAFGVSDTILREVTVSALINNNVQLSFIGKLLEGTGSINSGFRINWKNEWGTPVNIGF